MVMATKKKSKYKVGTKVVFSDPQNGESFEGKVIDNYKIPGDICVKWETGFNSSYDEKWLDKNTMIIKDQE